MRFSFMMALPALLVCIPASRAQDVGSAMRADHWDEAAEYAAAYPDPAARKLVTFYRLLAPNAATENDINDFMTANPDWPQRELLARRRDEALAREPDDATAAAVCTKAPPTLAPAWQRCASALSQTGQASAAADAARQAWINLPANPLVESTMVQRWSATLRPEDQWHRFDNLAWTDTAGAARQIPRLDPSQRAAAEARLALRRDEANALALVTALPVAQRSDPAIFLEQARYLRRASREAEAVALWSNDGKAAETRAPAAHLPAFWAERNLLARRHLRLGDTAGAYAVAAGHAQHASEQVADAEFLAGFIALRFLKDPERAATHFRVVATAAKAAITQARAHYWLARAAAAQGDTATQQAERAAASVFASTYYGQLAILGDAHDSVQLHDRIAALRDPVWTDPQALDFAGRELTRAAVLLVTWGEKRRAFGFLLRLEDLAPDDAHRALPGRLATGLALPELAVAIARRAGREGVMLPQTGWPIPVTVPDGPVPPAAVLGVIRQESGFDAGAVSPVGARGLMQLMPATATSLAKKVGQMPTLQSLTGDPNLNILLGTTYFRGLLDQFGDQLPLAVAAYNAGPSRVNEWLASNGDPRTGQVDMIDWIELIPFDETRNYVQRVSENIAMYAVRRNDPTPLAMAEWQKSWKD